MIQIPVTNQPNQSFEVLIPLGDTNLLMGFFIYWNRQAEYWQMTLTNPNTGEDYIVGLPLVTGGSPTENLLRQWTYLEIGEAYVVPIAADAPDYPAVDGWGVTHVLTWGP